MYSSSPPFQVLFCCDGRVFWSQAGFHKEGPECKVLGLILDQVSAWEVSRRIEVSDSSHSMPKHSSSLGHSVAFGIGPNWFGFEVQYLVTRNQDLFRFVEMFVVLLSASVAFYCCCPGDSQHKKRKLETYPYSMAVATHLQTIARCNTVCPRRLF